MKIERVSNETYPKTTHIANVTSRMPDLNIVYVVTVTKTMAQFENPISKDVIVPITITRIFERIPLLSILSLDLRNAQTTAATTPFNVMCMKAIESGRLVELSSVESDKIHLFESRNNDEIVYQDKMSSAIHAFSERFDVFVSNMTILPLSNSNLEKR